MKIGELFVSLGFKIEGADKLDATEKSIKQTAVTATKATLAIGALAAAFFVLIDLSAKAGQTLRNFALSTGLSTDELQMWQHTAGMANISAGEVTSAIKTLQNARTQFALGEPEAVGAWSLLGVDPRQDPFKVLADLRVALTRFKDVGVARNLVGKVGLESLLPILRSTNAEFEKWSRSFIINQKQIAQLSKLNGAWQSLKMSISSVKTQFAVIFAPVLEKVARGFEWFAEKIADVVQWLQRGSPLATIIKWGLIAIAGAFILVAGALTLVTAGLAAATVAFFALDVAASPWVPVGLLITAIVLGIIAAITGLVLVIDDLWTAFNGGDAVVNHMGDYLEKFFVWRINKWIDNIRSLKAAFSDVVNFAGAAANGPGGLAAYFGERAAMKGSTTSNSTRVNNDIDVHIDGAQDARTTGRAVVSSLRGELSQAIFQSPVGSY